MRRRKGPAAVWVTAGIFLLAALWLFCAVEQVSRAVLAVL